MSPPFRRFKETVPKPHPIGQFSIDISLRASDSVGSPYFGSATKQVVPNHHISIFNQSLPETIEATYSVVHASIILIIRRATLQAIREIGISRFDLLEVDRYRIIVKKGAEMAGLSKSRILLHRQCPRRLWLQTKHPELAEEDAGTTSRLSAGSQVGEIARTLYPNGVLIDDDNLSDALSNTAKVLAGGHGPVFEATFNAEGLLIRADLLLPDGDFYRVVEVKSSTGVKDYHLEDAAVQSWVVRQNGVPLSTIELAHIDSSFVYPGGGNYSGLFAYADISEKVLALQADVPGWILAAQNTLAGDEPSIEPGEQCHKPFSCPFVRHCSPPVDENGFPPEILPYGKVVAAELRTEGISDLRQVAEGRLSNPKHLRIWRATLAGEMVLDPAVRVVISALAYPRYFLDFETIQFAIPIWAGTRPYQQVPFQWSCHIEGADGALVHKKYLADGSTDPRRQFAETLIAGIGESGPILVYNASFECSRMKELASAFPDLSPALGKAITRVVDLLPIARDHYYHPDMRGSWSIKAVLPTIAPHLSYEDLVVGNGGMAMETFAKILDPSIAEDEKSRLHEALLKYCERDTLAMVEIAHFFENSS